MKRPLKIILAASGALVLVVAVVAVLALNLDPNSFKGKISQTVKATSGLDVAFDGPISVSYFPSLGVRLKQVTVGAPQEAGGGVLAKLGSAEVSVKLMPLFSGRVETGEITLDGLEVNLVRDEQGKLNLPKSPVKEVKLEDRKVVVITQNDERYSFDYQIKDVKITNSAFSFEDKAGKTKASVTDFNLSTGAVVRGQPFPVKLGFAWTLSGPDLSGKVALSGKGMAIPEAMRFDFENADFDTSVTGKALPVSSIEAKYTGTVRVDGNKQTFVGEHLTFSATARGGAAPKDGVGFNLAADVKSDMMAGTADVTGLSLAALDLSLSGEAHVAGAKGGAGTMKASFATKEFNLRQFLARLGQTLPPMADQSALTRFKTAFSVEGSDNAFSLKTSELKLDDTSMSLALDVKDAGTPVVNLAFKADSLDADRYMPPESKEKSASKKDNAGGRSSETWSVPATVTGSAEIGKLKAAKLRMHDLSVRFSLKDSVLTLDPFSVALYRGSVKGSARVAPGKGQGSEATLSTTVGAEGIQVGELLTDLTGKTKITGTAGLHASVSAHGLEAKRALSSLNGKASFAVRNGAVLGFDLSPDVFSSKEKLMAQGQGQAHTNFDVVSGSYNIVNGVAQGNDLLVSAPPNKVTGQGWVNLASETLDYKLKVDFLKLPTIPVHLSGSLDSPSVSLDAAAAAVGVAKGVLQAPGDVGKGAMDAVGGVLNKLPFGKK